MNKPANTRVPLHDLLQDRWSPRAFSSEAIDDETVIGLLEAARWAPSSRNLQPWRFIVETQANPEGFNKLAGGLVEFNRSWASKAYVLIAAISERRAEGAENSNGTADYDTGLAVSNLTTQATAKELYVHQMGGIHRDKIKEAYNLPEGYEPIAVLAIGYMGSPDDLSEQLQERERAARERKALKDIAFSGDWGQEADVLK